MNRLLGYGTLTLCVLAAIGAAAQQQPNFRASSDTVRVFATVTDRDGRLVPRLAQGDFEVRDEGKPQPITIFDNTPQAVRLIVMLDVSGSMEGNLQLLRDGASELFTRLRPDDEVRVGTFGYDVDISREFTNDPRELRSQLPRQISPDAPTPLWRAVDAAMTEFGDKHDVRSVILVLSDGKDSGPLSFKDHYVSQVEVIDRARKEDVMVYGIGMHSRRSLPRTPGIGAAGLQAALLEDLPDSGLAKVAQETGGGYTEIRLNQDLGAAFARVADELHGQYLLGYAPPRRDGKSHEIEVKVSGSGLKARARRSYVAPKG
jgi:Ca-activated chloride channel family protein